MKWNFCMYVAQQIEKIAGKEFYKRHGKEVIDIIMAKCEYNFEIVRYPEDEEIVEVINEVIK